MAEGSGKAGDQSRLVAGDGTTGDRGVEGVAHSPGPWRPLKEDGRLFIVDANDCHVCTMARWVPKVDRADSSLIAAAPDMLAALVNALSMLRAFGGDLTKFPKSEADAGHIDAVMWTAQQQIVAAIARAEGRS